MIDQRINYVGSADLRFPLRMIRVLPPLAAQAVTDDFRKTPSLRKLNEEEWVALPYCKTF